MYVDGTLEEKAHNAERTEGRKKQLKRHDKLKMELLIVVVVVCMSENLQLFSSGRLYINPYTSMTFKTTQTNVLSTNTNTGCK